MLSHTRMGVPYEYTHMGRPIRIWANIRIWGRTTQLYKKGNRKEPSSYRLISVTCIAVNFWNIIIIHTGVM